MLSLNNKNFLIILQCVFIFHLHAGIEKYFRKIEEKSRSNEIANIDFIYMINLDHRKEKYQSTVQALTRYNIHPYRFSAINGWNLSFEAIDDLGIVFQPGMPEGPIATVYRHVGDKEYQSCEIMKEPGVTYYSHSLSRGAIGCIMSHLSILQDAFDAGYETIWIIEDDIYVASDPRELSFLISSLNHLAPDWDVFFTDTEIKGADGNPVPCTMIRPRPLLNLQPLDYYLKRTHITRDIIKIRMRFGSHSMVVHRTGMKKILDFYKTYKIYFPYDIDYFFIPEINLYNCTRDIVTNIPGWLSDNAKIGG
ncbi:MAG TPA: glycosyltransferase family 25 protein [Rhabdochlamydiaceae bacterium]|jgi:GR25 family glycosyltransferase involved in LPS biosynthesis